MEQPSASTIRLYFESDAFDLESGQVFIFPAKPSEEIMDQIRQGTFQVTPVAFIGSVAEPVPIYGPGHYSGGFGNLKLRAKREDRRWTADQVALPRFMISPEDIERGECHLLLPAVATLKVVVVDNQGRTAAGKKVCILEPGRSQCGETGIDGALTVQLALGRYPVTVTDGEWCEVELRDNFAEVSVVLRQPGRSCRVQVVDKQGQSRPRCTLVRAIREDKASDVVTVEQGEGWSFALGKELHRSTCGDGSAYFTGLDAGTYRFELKDQPESAVTATIENFEPHTITLVAD